MRWPRHVILLILTTLVAGCSEWQSALHPRGLRADSILSLFWVFLIVSAIVWTAVVIALLIALVRRRRERLDPLDLDPSTEWRGLRVIAALSSATAAVVIALALLSYFPQRTVFARPDDSIPIRVVGHQWWWEIEYGAATPDRLFTTANEIRVPVGKPVTVTLETTDVIHSFWVPSLMGKMDLINNQTNTLHFTAERPGVYRGQCAEFCGLQHAFMGMLVIASSAEDYEAWHAKQLEPAAAPQSALDRRGEELFRRRGCALCHTIEGTSAGGRLGPDLTHLASRQSLAAARLPMTAAALAAWISDPQHLKPGSFMPAQRLSGDELTALVSYLSILK
jgi:cytochrome c oxidase subunit II